MERIVGTTVRGLRAPIVNEGQDIGQIVVDTVLKASEIEGYSIKDHDIICVTESIVARAQGNYASIDAIATDIQNKFKNRTIGVVFPILSRNRFEMILKGIARGTDHVVIQLSYPADEVGNHLVTPDDLDEKGINPWSDVLDEEGFRQTFGDLSHRFTGVDYVQLYKNAVESEGATVEFVFSNHPTTILDYTSSVLVSDIHTRGRTKRIVKEAGAQEVFGLEDILTTSIDGSGFNSEYGLLGANAATDNSIKLFPEGCQDLVEEIQSKLFSETGKQIEAMVYGDGAFKDPSGKIWELADPVVSPGFTAGLSGTPNEVKLKYLADNDFDHLEGIELEKTVSEYIKNHKAEKPEKVDQSETNAASLGTTPRQITELLGSLADLTSGSGDKGTPFVYIQGYFDSYADQ